MGSTDSKDTQNTTTNAARCPRCGMRLLRDWDTALCVACGYEEGSEVSHHEARHSVGPQNATGGGLRYSRLEAHTRPAATDDAGPALP